MSGGVLRPARAITETARRASDQHLGERLALTGAQDELKELADTFDDMLERLDLAFAAQRRFVANASHELRTPLTVMRTAIDVALAKPNRTTGQLEDMAARVHAGRPVPPGPERQRRRRGSRAVDRPVRQHRARRPAGYTQPARRRPRHQPHPPGLGNPMVSVASSSVSSHKNPTAGARSPKAGPRAPATE